MSAGTIFGQKSIAFEVHGPQGTAKGKISWKHVERFRWIKLHYIDGNTIQIVGDGRKHLTFRRPGTKKGKG